MSKTIEEWAERLYGSQKLDEGGPYLRDEPKPTRQQVSAVLHALADHTAITNMLAVAEDMGGSSTWPEATGIGRYYQRLGDALEAPVVGSQSEEKR